MSSSLYGVRLICALLPPLFLLPVTYGQTTGAGATVSIIGLPAYPTQSAEVRYCLWDQDYDIAYSLGCAKPTNNACYCPTGVVQQASVLNIITGCMTYWYPNVAALELPSAVSVYSEYCKSAVGDDIGITAAPTQTTAPTTSTTSPTATSSASPSASPDSSGGGGSKLSTGAIIGIAIGGVVALFIICTLLYWKVKWFRKLVDKLIKFDKKTDGM